MKVFIHIPKTGGSSVRQALIESGHYFDWMRGHWTASQILGRYRLYRSRPAELFTVVRNPYDRFASTYFFIKRAKNRCSLVYDNFSRLSFDEFTFLFLQKWNSIEMVDNYHHFLPQRTYFDTDAPIKVFRTEDLTKVNDYLGLEKLGLCLTKQNVGDYKEPYDALYTPETKKIVREFYHADFEKFGY